MTTGDHLDNDLIAAYAESRVAAAERGPVEGHLADCAECRREVIVASRALRRERRRARWLAGAPLMAAAAVLLVVVWGRRSPAIESADPRLRPVSGSEGVARIEAWSPPADAPVAPDSLRFVWGADGPDALYRLTVADVAGTVVWSLQTGDTTALMPGSVRLQPGGRYLWYVDVQLVSGERATTGVRALRIAP
jgi:anti-sigma factor RsiW